MRWFARRQAQKHYNIPPPDKNHIDWFDLPLKEQMRVIDQVAMSIGRHPDMVTLADIATWEIREEAF